MGNTLQGNQVLLFGAQRDIAPHPVVQLGVDANGLAKPVLVAADGSLSIAAGTATIGKVAQAQYAGVPSSFAFQTAGGTVFTLAAGEVGFIQNCDTDALAVKKGAGASAASLNMILKGCSTADDGSGGYTVIKDWVGAVSVAAMTGAARYLAWKQTL